MRNFVIQLGFLIIILSDFGCVPIKKMSKISGTYVYVKASTDSQELILNQDGTFSYNLSFDVGGRFTFKGKWQVEDGVVVLEGYRPALDRQVDPSFLLETKTIDAGKSIKVYDIEDSTTLVGADVIVNDLVSAPIGVGADGSAKLPVIAINNIGIKFLSFCNIQFKVKDPEANLFEAYVKIQKAEPWLNSIPTTRWHVGRKKLISLGKDGNSNTLMKINQAKP